jgi:hypothetical protein
MERGKEGRNRDKETSENYYLVVSYMKLSVELSTTCPVFTFFITKNALHTFTFSYHFRVVQCWKNKF